MRGVMRNLYEIQEMPEASPWHRSSLSEARLCQGAALLSPLCAFQRCMDGVSGYTCNLLFRWLVKYKKLVEWLNHRMSSEPNAREAIQKKVLWQSKVNKSETRTGLPL